jgi:hypothetical protein
MQNSNIEPQERETWNECCPWCGRSVSDLSDYSIGEMFFEFDCPRCEKPIKAMRQTIVEYRFVPNETAASLPR